MMLNRHLSRETILFFSFTLVSFFYVFYPFSIKEPIITADAVFDVQIVRNLLFDRELGWQATFQPPFHAILTAAINPLVPNILIAGIFISKLMWWLLPLPVYGLAKELFGSKIALFSALLVFFHPHFYDASTTMEPAMTYSTMLMWGFYFSWLAFSRKSLICAISGGIFYSFAYLSRSEGLLIFIFALLALLYIYCLSNKNKDERQTRIWVGTLLIFVFILVSLPYLLFLKNTYGQFVLSPKSSYVQTWMKWRVYKDNNLGEIGNPELWGLTQDGKLKWQEPKGLSGLYRYLMSNPQKSLNVYLRNLWSHLPGNITNSSGQPNYPQVYPFYFVIPMLIWVIYSIKRGKECGKILYLLSPFPIVFILPVFTHGWCKYLMPYSPFLIILAVPGIALLVQKLRWTYLLTVFASITVLYSFWVTKVSSTVEKSGSHITTNKGQRAEEIKMAGSWAKERFQGRPNYMVQWVRLAYYLDGRWTAMPATSLDKMISYANKNDVDYIVVETWGDDHRRQVLAAEKRLPSIAIADIYRSELSDYGVVFLKLMK